MNSYKTKPAKAFRTLADYGGLNVGTPEGNRTPIYSSGGCRIKTASAENSSSYKNGKTARTGQRTVSHDKPIVDSPADSPSELPPDLAGIVAAWPSIPGQIKEAVKAVLAPYIKEGDE